MRHYFLSLWAAILTFVFLGMGSLYATSPQLVVYITVDDGPISGTQEIIDIINKLDVPVSFMLIGEHIEASEGHKKLLKESESDSRILVGNHSYTHASDHYKRFYENPKGVLLDFQKNQKLLQSMSKKPIKKIARLPGRNVWVVEKRKDHDLKDAVASADLLAKDGYTVFGWDLEWTHNPRTGEPIQSAAMIVREIMKKAPHAFTPGHVVLLTHDEMFHTPNEGGALRELLEELKKNGAVFKTLAEYPLT